jgi:transposase-like protein
MDQAEVEMVGQETEVTDHAKRRSFTAEYKRRIVREADSCQADGEIGALLRREGLYSSHLCTWRAARDRGELASGIETKKRGPTAAPPDPRDLEIQRLQRDNTRLEKRATRAEALVDIQKKVAALLGRPFESEDS